MRFSLSALVAALFLPRSAVATKGGNSKDDKGPSYECSGAEPDGYKQVNTLLSHAYSNLARDGTLYNLCLYNDGLPTPEGWAELCRGTKDNTPDPNSCTRRWDDNSGKPAGILAEAICTGTFKWCVHESALGDSLSDNFIVTAEKDNFLENIKAGDLIGGNIPYFRALTNEMAKILHSPLEMELIFVGGNFFDDVVGAMGNDICYAATGYFRHPYREASADFTCPWALVPAAGFGVLALEESSLDLSDIFANAGAGATICKPGAAGDTTASLIERDFPNAQVVERGLQGLLTALCRGECDVTVGSIQGYTNYLAAIPECAGKTLSSLNIASPSSAGDGGAITYRVK